MVVSGGAGFIGSHAVEYFSDKGWSVTAIDNLSRGKTLGQKGLDTSTFNWRYLESKGTVSLVNASVLDALKIEEQIRDAHSVIHTAGQVAVTKSLSDPMTDFNTNMLGTFNILEACRKASENPSIIFCSTNKVYGENVNKIPVSLNGSRYRYDNLEYSEGIPETFSVDGCEHTPYGASKLSADIYVQEYAHTYGLKTGVFRMSCIYGTRQFGNEDQGWVAHFVLSALRNKVIKIYGDGNQVRDILYIDDLLEAYNAFIDSSLKHAVFNIGGGHKNTISLLEFLDSLNQLTGHRTEVIFDDWRNGDQKVFISDIGKISEKLNWYPKVSPSEGILKLYTWATETLGPELIT